MFNKDLVKREDFANTTSYNAAIWAGEICNKMLNVQQRNNQFFFEGEPLVVKFEFDYNGFEISLKSDETSYVCFVGDQHHLDNDNFWKVWCTKKELTEFFKRFKFTPKAQFKSVV